MKRTKTFSLLRAAALSGCFGMTLIMTIVGAKLNLNLSDYVFPMTIAIILFTINLILIPFSKEIGSSHSSVE